MKNVVDALKLLAQDVADLSVPSKAVAAAGVLAPIIAAIAGVDVTAPELAADLGLAGTVVATLERVLLVKKAKAAAKAARAKRAR